MCNMNAYVYVHAYIYIYILALCLPQITINVKFVGQNIILSVLTNKPYEAGSLCFYLDVPFMCMYALVSIINNTMQI